MSRLLLTLLLLPLALAADPYDAWAQGRPAEAVRPLVAAARADGRWDAWLDAGLAAAAAGDRGRAVACLAEAMNRAPERDEPRAALRALGVPLPTSWGERCGPMALPGRGWAGVAVLALAGLALGAGLALRRRRTPFLVIAAICAAAAAPGVLAPILDGRTTWLATVRDSELLDSTGAPQRPLPAGTLLERAAAEAWAGRILVRDAHGALGYVAGQDASVE